MTQPKEQKKGISPGWVIAILAALSIFMAVITVRTRHKIETIQKEHMLHPEREKLQPIENTDQPSSPLNNQ